MVDLALLKVALGLLADGGHGLDRLDGVHARGGLAREHDAVGAVVHRVGHVSNLGTGGTRVVAHGVEHLCGHNDRLVGISALGDDALLDVGDLLGGHLNAKVAAGDHDAVGVLKDLVKVLDGSCALDL